MVILICLQQEMITCNEENLKRHVCAWDNQLDSFFDFGCVPVEAVATVGKPKVLFNRLSLEQFHACRDSCHLMPAFR